MTNKLGSRWTNDERSACVEAYAGLWLGQRNAVEQRKADVIRSLLKGVLSGRNEAAVRLRFANISAVMEARGAQPLIGYVPARNISPAEHDRLGAMLEKAGLI